MELLHPPMISVIVVVVKLKPDYLKGVFVSSLHFNEIKHVHHYHKSLVMSCAHRAVHKHCQECTGANIKQEAAD